MATFDTSRTTYGSASVASRFFTMISATVASVIAWNDARVTRNALAALTDRELEDIGLSRSDIDAVADSNIIR
ncbi:DUF1127 domain-containing protein [uncultured Roseobacter sp.]|uniref:DUF1127 domain-containing protein n=1 Tax=uncultured Roseobacter sp. TaxID=114847 RepID=UPI00261B904B|nr:DUF1127 domain-containing protein [uncultured Roseobacter sp.]